MIRLRELYCKYILCWGVCWQKSHEHKSFWVRVHNSYFKKSYKIASIYYVVVIFLLFILSACKQESTKVYTILEGKLPVDIEYVQINYGQEQKNFLFQKKVLLLIR